MWSVDAGQHRQSQNVPAVSPVGRTDRHINGFRQGTLRQALANFYAQETKDKEMVMHCTLQPDIC